ncbi:MAG: heavy-metal-associated domain-containing protein [Deltaproteobacteria bacterium]|nr:heavy-metal-associated domain-containing protein [Deltaproteobacteria bacterium]
MQTPQAATPTQRVLLQVEGLSCGSCEARVRKALTEKPGVRAVDVNLSQKTVTVEYEEGAADPKELADRITRLGYPARFLASGPGVPGPKRAEGKPAGGCGGDCCNRGT